MKLWKTLRTWFRGRRAPLRPVHRTSPGRWRPALEQLEDRQLLSASGLQDLLSHEVWRELRFEVGEVALASDMPRADVDLQTTLETPAQAGDFGSLIGLDQAFDTQAFRGEGYSIAVIDTGIDYRHHALGGGWGNRVVAGWDFVNNDADPLDDNGHGTHVAGIIGGSSGSFNGLAPSANLIALKVLDASGSGSFGNVEDALQWVIQHQAQYNIVAVNMSLGSGNFTTNPYAFLEDEFSTLRGQGVFLAAAAGNSFYSFASRPGLGFPAISSQTVSVGAVWSGNFGAVSWASGARDYTTEVDRIASFSQRSSELDILAPGALVTSTYLNGGYRQMAGTSMAAPVVAGAAVLLHQALDTFGFGAYANQEFILSLMQNTGQVVVDGDDENDNVVNTGLQFRRLDVHAALASIQAQHNRAPTLAAIADRVLTGGASTLQIPVQAADADGDPLTYSVVLAPARTLWDLDQQYRFELSGGSFHQNAHGFGERWVRSAVDGGWFALLTTGELRRFNDYTLATSPTVAQLPAFVYADPALLWNPALPVDPNAAATRVAAAWTGTTLTLTVPDGFTGMFQVTVSVSDGKDLASRTFQVQAANSPPTLQGIADRMMATTQDRLQVALSAQDADGDALSYQVQLSRYDALKALDDQLGLSPLRADYAANYHGRGEKWLVGSNGLFYALLPNGELRRFDYYSLTTSPVVAGLPTFVHADPTLLWNAQAQRDPNSGVSRVTASITGDVLTLDPPAGFVGIFQATVTVGDGTTTASTSFLVQVTADAANQTPLPDRVVPRGQQTVVVPLASGELNAAAAGLTVALSKYEQLLLLAGQYGLTAAHATYLLNAHGHGEKWLRGSDGGWYALLPTGQLRRFDWYSLATSPVLATLPGFVFEDPTLLTGAVAPLDPNAAASKVGAVLQGGDLVLTVPAGFLGPFQVTVTDALGHFRSFVVNVVENAPTLAAIPNQTLTAGTPLQVNVSATAAPGSTITYQAALAGWETLARRLDRELNLTYAGSYYTNAWGMGEKWVTGNGVWYCLLGNGELRRWGGSAAATLQASNLIATLDASLFHDPSLLWNAPVGSAPVVQMSWSGNRLTLNLTGNFRGTFTVAVTARVGSLSVVREFQVTVG